MEVPGQSVGYKQNVKILHGRKSTRREGTVLIPQSDVNAIENFSIFRYLSKQIMKLYRFSCSTNQDLALGNHSV